MAIRSTLDIHFFHLPMAALALISLLSTACGVIIYDTTSRVLILEPVERMVFDSDGGTIEVYAFDRTAISLFYHLTGFETSIADIGHVVEGDALRAFFACDGDQLCAADYYCEVPLGTAIEIDADGAIKLTGVDAPVVASVKTGDVEGVGLRSPDLDLTVETGAVTLAWSSPPVAVQIGVTTGDVTLTIPAGSYRCNLATANGTVEMPGITCDPAAAGVLEIDVQTGDIRVEGTP